MAGYRIEIAQSAEKQLRKIPGPDRKRLARTMLRLADEPFPRGTRKLSGYDDVYRVRAGRYRILYSVSNARLIVLVLKIGHRKGIFR